MVDANANEHAGFHQFHSEESQESYGSFEVYWLDTNRGESGGWYWHAGFPGCLADGDANGPFATSREALRDADEWNPVFDSDCS